MEVVTVWLAIDPSTTKNGCMVVIPKSHRDAQQKIREKSLVYQPTDVEINIFDEEIKNTQFNETEAVPCELQPNHASLHDAHTIHGSPPNTSQIRRCGYTMRYMKSSIRMNPENLATHCLYLARGRDHGTNPLSDPTRSYTDLLNNRKSNKRGH